MRSSVKHPRIGHLPWSSYADADDIACADTSALVGREVVVLEKRDGECTTLYADHHHARSVLSGPHPSRSKLAALHARVSSLIPPDIRICGENVSAVHTLRYHALRSIFETFSAWRGDECLSWDETERLATVVGLCTVPLLWRGEWDELAIRTLDVTRSQGDPCEGYVVRPAHAFSVQEFDSVVMKHRAVAMNAGEHWMHKRVEWNCVAGHCKHGVTYAAR